MNIAPYPPGPMADNVYLVRHGEVFNPAHIVYADLKGYGLSDRGRAQAAAAAGRLPEGASIISSPLQRAVETSGIIAAALDTQFAVDEDLTEWLLGRRWAGHTWEEIDTIFPGELTAYLKHPERLPFASESLDRLAARVAGAARRHRRAAPGSLILVSHQDPIQAGRLSLTGKPLTDLQRDKPGHGAVITLDPTVDDDWQELEVWSPPQGDRFPPV